ncbi:short chain dehydrogenase [Xylariaceae sp. FL0662B]|nr:short chain dehydrogenase [Xylariaceae sp. FL0662B]
MSFPPSSTVLSTLGALLSLTVLYKTLDFIWLYTRPSNLEKYLHATAGKPAWALVTGSSAGIGRAIAFELASKGFNVVIHCKNPKNLEDTREQLSQAYPDRSFRAITADATQCAADTALLDRIVETIDDINLTVLVNNVGGTSVSPLRRPLGTIEQYSPQDILDTVHLSAVFPALVSAALIPRLVRNGPSLIINICSLADNGVPLVSFYSASKAFDHTLSLSLSREMVLEGRDVEIIACRPGLTSETQGIKNEPSFFAPPARTVAKAVLKRIGCGRKSVIPYWGHALQQILLDLIPPFLGEKFMIKVIRDVKNKQDAKVD